MLTTITVLNRAGEPRTVNAIVDGLFAITPGCSAPDVDGIGIWTVTHVPTGTAVLTTYSPVHARAAMRELMSLPLDWRSDKLTKYRRQRRIYKIPVMDVCFRLNQQGVRVVM